jgi:hypothetical protein
MKKVFLIAAIAALSTGVKAQINFGAQVGANMANVKSEYTSGSVTTQEDTKSKVGFLVGVVAEIPLGTSLSFRPELNFIQKGAKIDATQTENSGGATITSVSTGKTTLNFIELPLNIVYGIPAGAGRLFFGAGPSVGFGISGKYDGTTTSTLTAPGFPTQTQTTNDKGDVKFDGKKDADVAADDVNMHLKSLDFGANVLAGYKMSNGMYINVGYTMGFSNLDPNANSSLKTKGLTLKIGYMFGGNKASE